MQAGEKAWLALLGNVSGYEAVAPEGQLLTDAFARFRIKHPAIALLGTVVVVAHLWDVTPRCVDPISGLGWIVSRLR